MRKRERITEQEFLSQLGEKLDKIISDSETTQAIYGIAWEIHKMIIDRMKMNYSDQVKANARPQ